MLKRLGLALLATTFLMIGAPAMAQGLGVAATALKYATCFQQAFAQKEPESTDSPEPSA